MTTPTILTFSSHDGSTLHYRHWSARKPSGRALLLFHRGHEHGGRVAHLVEELALPDMDVFAWDARGHGLNEGPRGYAPNIGCLTRDVESFVAHLTAAHGLQLDQTVVIAQSVGAVVATSWVHDYAPRLRGLVLASPAFSVKLYVPAAIPGLKLMQAFRGEFFVNSYVKAHYLTHDPERQASFNSDPLITRPIASNILLELYDVADRLVEDAGAIEVPTLMLVSGKDYVVRKAQQQAFFLRLGASMKRWVTLPGFFHDTLGELGRETALRHIRQFVDECFEQPAAPVRFPALLQAHKQGFTFDEFEALSKPAMPAWRNAMFRLVRGLMTHVGARLSQGIKIGVETGFDSGAMLDYVYLNQPQGAGPVGRFIDRIYLDSIGWRGIRQRRVHLADLLAKAIRQARAEGQPIRIVDIAAGHGRYVLDALAAVGLEHGDSVLLRDWSEANVSAGRRLIETMGLSAQVKFERGDAFDPASLASLDPSPTIALVSGLYELFPDNDLVSASLRGLAAAMAPGSQLLYTGQPWHPQLEFIARVLTSHRNGQSWVMRRRTQLEMDELVSAAGFDKQTGIADRWGIFTVSLATRRAV
jgi:alpha-beta hydrolase superfamily lysophospholipase